MLRSDTLSAVEPDNELVPTASLDGWQQQLVRRILMSPRFEGKGEPTKVLLVRLIESSFPAKRADRQKKGDEKNGPQLKLPDKERVIIGRLRKALHYYFESEGRHEPWQLCIDTYTHRVRFVRQHLNELWAPHLPSPKGSSAPHNLAIVYPEPRFFRSKAADCFIRHRFINDDTSNQKKRKIADKARPKLELSGMQESRQYVGAGDTRSMLALTTWFERKNVHTSHLVAHLSKWNNINEADSVLLIGNSRTSWVVTDVTRQMDVQFRIADSGIDNPINPKRPFKDEHRSEKANTRTAFGCFVRRRHPDTQKVLSCILVNEGPLLEVIAEYLTKLESVRELFRNELELGDDDGHPLPNDIELLFAGKIDSSDHPVHGSLEVIGRRLNRTAPVVMKPPVAVTRQRQLPTKATTAT
jgi:hypothetical protein